MQALLLVGHGSRHTADASAPVYAHAERIRRLGIFDEVRTAFWKEDPLLRDALGRIESEDVFVVPIFLAEGYYTREVVPRELRLDGELTRRGSRCIRYCPPIGAHRGMDELVVRRALQVTPLPPTQRRWAALVIIGHGTDRSVRSGATVHEVTARLRKWSGFGIVECGFLDEAPRIETVVRSACARQIVLVPFFVAEGWHTRETIPERLGLTGRRTYRHGRTLWYAPPVGTLPQAAELVVDLAREAGARIDLVGRGRSTGTESRRRGVPTVMPPPEHSAPRASVSDRQKTRFNGSTRDAPCRP